MSRCATLIRMATRTTRQLAGEIIRDERVRAHLSQDEAAEQWGLSRGTIARIEVGKETVADLTFRNIEGGLGLPRYFFRHVINGDRERIKRLPSRLDDPISGLQEDVRHMVLDALEDLGTPLRRATDERKHA